MGVAAFGPSYDGARRNVARFEAAPLNSPHLHGIVRAIWIERQRGRDDGEFPVFPIGWQKFPARRRENSLLRRAILSVLNGLYHILLENSLIAGNFADFIRAAPSAVDAARFCDHVWHDGS